jgi:tRNA dimethylallyltransferase
MPVRKKVIIIAGPTAAGKTALAIELARKYNAEIISADSRQCFKEMNIGVARPTTEELVMVPHHFIATHSIHETVSAATFENYAISKVSHLFQQFDTVVMVGGTGLYIKAFCEGLDLIPEVTETIRENIRKHYAVNGIHWLQKEVEQKDPEFYANGEIQNPQRLMRALEVVESTGQSILFFQKNNTVKREFDTIKLAITPEKAQLQERINSRVDHMKLNGLQEEVECLLPFRHLNALQTVGYKELFDHFEGMSTLPEAIKRIKIHTRQYAKRQLTWFRKDPSFQWFESDDIKALFEHVETSIKL